MLAPNFATVSRRPCPVHIPDWTLVPKDDGIAEGKNFRQPVSRDSLQLAPISLGRGEKQ